jgi:hypothetical protein
MWVLEMNLFDTPAMGKVVKDDFDDLGIRVLEPRYSAFIVKNVLIHKSRSSCLAA